MSIPFNEISNEISYNEISNEIPMNPLALDIPITPDFSFLSPSNETAMKSAYQVIQRMECWHILRNFHDESFMFTHDSRVIAIMDAVNNSYDGHSAGSLGCTMRDLQYIAKYGFSEYRRKMLEPEEDHRIPVRRPTPMASQYLPQ